MDVTMNENAAEEVQYIVIRLGEEHYSPNRITIY